MTLPDFREHPTEARPQPPGRPVDRRQLSHQLAPRNARGLLGRKRAVEDEAREVPGLGAVGEGEE